MAAILSRPQHHTNCPLSGGHDGKRYPVGMRSLITTFSFSPFTEPDFSNTQYNDVKINKIIFNRLCLFFIE